MCGQRSLVSNRQAGFGGPKFSPCEATLLDGSIPLRLLLVDVTSFRRRKAERQRFSIAGHVIDFPDLPSNHPPEQMRYAHSPGGGAVQRIGPADHEVAHLW